MNPNLFHRKIRSARARAILSASIGAVLALHAANAVDQTYDPLNVSNVWDLGMTNWDGSTVLWTNGNNAIFGVTGESVTVNAAITIGDITFNSTGYTIANGTGDLTLANAVNTVTVTNLADTATIAESIAGTGRAIVKAGVGTLSLTSANTYSGGTTISAGTVSTSNAAGFGTGTIAVGVSGTATFVGVNANVGNVITGTGILNFTGAGNNTVFTSANSMNGFTGTVNVNITGNGKIALNTAGNTIGSGATVNVAAGSTFYSSVNTSYDGVTFNLAGGGNGENLGALRLETGATIGSTSSVVLGGNSNVGSNGAANIGSINANISQTGGARTLTKLATGTIVLGGANSYTGGTTISGGALQFSKLVSMPATGVVAVGTNTIIINAGGAGEWSNEASGLGTIGGLLAGTGGQGTATVTYGATATVGIDTTNASGSLTYAGNISNAGRTIGKYGTGSLLLTGDLTTGAGGVTVNAGALTLSGNNNYTGAVTVTAGTLNLGSATALGGAGTTALNGGTIDNTFGTAIVSSRSASIGGNFTFGSTGETAVNNLTFSGTTGFSNDLSRTITMAGTGTTLTLGSIWTNNQNSGRNLVVNGAGNTFSLAGLLLNSGGNTASTQTINGSGNVIIAGVVGNGTASGAQGLSYTGTGTLTLNGNNSYAGLTTLNNAAGTLTLAGNNTGTGGVTLTAGTLNINAAGTGVTNSALGTGAFVIAAGTINNTSGAAITLVTNNAITVSNNFAVGTATSTAASSLNLGTGAVTWTNGGQRNITFNGTGQTLTFGGAVTSSNQGGNTALNVVGAGNTLVLGSFSLNGNNTARQFTFLGSGNTTINGAVSGGGIATHAVIKNEAGTLTFKGTNSYTGTTTVNAGTLALGSGGSQDATATTVNSTATLAIAQTASATTNALTTSSLTMNAGSAFAMADTFTSTATVGTTANLYAGTAGTAPTYTFDLAAATGVNDRLTITGAASFSNVGARISLNALGALTTGNTYTIATAASGLNGINAWTLAVGRTVFGSTAYALTLANTATTSIVTVGVSGAAALYWSGSQNGVWNTIDAGPLSNWNTDETTGTNAGLIPTSVTDVFFTTSNPVATNLTNALGANTEINSLHFTTTSGAVTIGAGNTLTINGGGITVASGSAPQTINAPITLGATQSFTNNSINTLTAGAVATGVNTLTIAGSGNTTLGGNLTGTGTLTKTATGTLTLGGLANTIKTLNINGTGIIDIGAGNLTLSNTGSATISTATGGTINATGGGTITLSGAIGASGDNFVASGQTLTINAKLTGNTDFEYFGGASQSGVFVLTADNNWTGNLVFSSPNGVVSVAKVGNISSTTSNLGQGSTISFAATNTKLIYTGIGETSNRILSIGNSFTGILDQSGAGNLNFSGNLAAGGNGTKVLALQGSTAGTGEISGVISNGSGTTQGITKAGTGTWTLSNANTYTGTTLISGGILRIDNATALNTTASSGTIQFTGGTLQYGTGITTNYSGKFSTAASQVFRIDTNGNDVSYGAAIQSSGGTFSKFGAGKLTLGSATSSYSGATTISGGTLSIELLANGGLNSGIGSASAAAASLVFDGGTLEYTGATVVSDRAFTINSAKTAAIDVTTGGASLSLSGATGAATNGALTKGGVGTLILTGVSNYTGATDIQAGTLGLGASGSIAGSTSINVASGATYDVSALVGYEIGASQTLKGNGIIVGNTTISGSLTPGTSPGKLTFQNDLTLAGTATFEISTGVRGTAYDAVDVQGNLNYGGGLTLTIAAPLANGTYDLFFIGGASAGALSTLAFSGGIYTAAFTNSSGVWTAMDGTQTFTFTQTTGDLLVVPEPGSAVSLIGGLGMLLGLQRFRRRVRSNA